jgi:hypothetical protein
MRFRFGRGRAIAVAAAGLSRVVGGKPRDPNEPPPTPLLETGQFGKRSEESGLAPICGWAFTGETDFPEGILEAAIDDDEWVELSFRTHVSGVAPDREWARRCGFNTAINTFLLSNGVHRLGLRVKTGSGRIAAARTVNFRVNRTGRVAEAAAGLIKRYPKSKKIWQAPIDADDFPMAEAKEFAWFERQDASGHVAEMVSRHKLPPECAEHFHHFIEKGYIVLDNFIAREWCDRINSDMDRLIAAGVFQLKFKGQRIEKLYEKSKAARDLWAHPGILRMLSALFDDVAEPCQTLNFLHGSGQDVHQDVIHLTPFPPGLMCGAWVALEDIHPDSGPLVVYPRSHRLPRLYLGTVGAPKVLDGNWEAFGAVYTPALQHLIDASGLQPEYYTPKAGSVLIWHENLAHGGSPRKNDELTRRSMVSHYFARGGLAFYDSTGMPGWTQPPDDD